MSKLSVTISRIHSEQSWKVIYQVVNARVIKVKSSTRCLSMQLLRIPWLDRSLDCGGWNHDTLAIGMIKHDKKFILMQQGSDQGMILTKGISITKLGMAVGGIDFRYKMITKGVK